MKFHSSVEMNHKTLQAKWLNAIKCNLYMLIQSTWLLLNINLKKNSDWLKIIKHQNQMCALTYLSCASL